mgnify:CR=1 FL=1
MQPEVVQAMQYASSIFVRLGDVQDAVSARIATLLQQHQPAPMY